MGHPLLSSLAQHHCSNRWIIELHGHLYDSKLLNYQMVIPIDISHMFVASIPSNYIKITIKSSQTSLKISRSPTSLHLFRLWLLGLGTSPPQDQEEWFKIWWIS
jgi:hypothetical protein